MNHTHKWTRLIPIGLFVFTTTIHANIFFTQPAPGYNTQTQVVGSREVFERRQFTPNDFNIVLSMLYRAQAIEQFLELSEKGVLSKMGEVQVEKLIIGREVYSKGQVISFDEIEDNSPPNYTAEDLFRALIKAKVLDNAGFVFGLQASRNIEFSPVDFSAYYERIKSIPLPLQSKQAQAGILNEINSLIIARHRAIEVTTHQTTNYRSANTNLFNGLIETIGGNWLSQTFSPDQVRTTKSDLEYAPQINLYGFYPIWAGFSPYPHFGGSPGSYIINGSTVRSSTEFQMMNGQDGSMVEITKAYDWTFGRNKPAFVGAFAYSELALRYLQVQNSTLQSRFYSASIPFFIAPNSSLSKRLEFKLFFGPTYSTNPTRNALGLHIGTAFTLPAFAYTDFTASIISHMQPGADQNNWMQTHANLGLQFSGLFPNLTLKTGVSWLNSNGSDISSWGLNLGVTYTGF
jgi:hypothetical protein